MLRQEAESSTSPRGSEVLLNSSARMRPVAGEKDPPSYGAQHRQDALWEGGNGVLPPRWHQYKVPDGRTHYQDDTLVMASSNRPLPGVRLDYLQLVPGCEWHISPLGRSYFVNHNTRTTSWKKSAPERPAGSLMPECIIEGHSHCISSLACLRTTCNILSASEDCSIRQWERDGEPAGKPLDSHGAQVCSMAVSPDETMVASGSPDGKIRLWNIKKGSMVGDPWEGHYNQVMCLDWSPNSLEIASGSEDGTIRRWNPDTGRQIAPPIETGHGWVNAVQYSPQGDTFTSGGEDEMISVWSKDGQLLIKIKGHESPVTSLCWSKEGLYIFSASVDYTIRKWRSIDGEELIVLRGHTNTVRSICLSPNKSHLVSASADYTVRIWDLKTNQQVGDPLLHDDELLAVVISPDGKYIVSAGLDAKIYVWSVEAALKQQGANAKTDAKLKATQPKHQANTRGSARYVGGNDFFGNDTNHTPHYALSGSPSSLIRWRHLLGPIHFGTRPADALRPIPRQPRQWNFNLFPRGTSSDIIDVAPSRKKNRIAIAPPTKAELDAAMQRANGNEANSSIRPGQLAPGAQGSQERPAQNQTQTQGLTGGTGDVSYEVNCCGLLFSCRRPTPLALLLSESKFTIATLTCALGSSVPFLLMYLPPPPSISSHSRVEATVGEVGSAFWNPALGGAQGLLRGKLDI
ncbi:WD40-repeat-containing domain protein [Suillus subaureus]|uniref:WD40-repeat-containing domain protein n=1 Tax=Suillus subaureus TaxID=48587 RepID=A0A9P7DU60_9AGAM|nr:WD40-repeat-containing domain protein [Suillus subaureus]KAG1803347.1 WD40-repeat-containing domain protein [Suillus subaureus]